MQSYHCPHCAAINDGHTDIDGNDIVPKSGDVSICIYCGRLGIFEVLWTGSVGIRMPTESEIDEVSRDPRVQKAVLLLQLRGPVKPSKRKRANDG